MLAGISGVRFADRFAKVEDILFAVAVSSLPSCLMQVVFPTVLFSSVSSASPHPKA